MLTGTSLPTPRFSTLIEAIDSTAQTPEALDFLSLDEQEQRLSWTELRDRALRVSNSLATLGIRRGDRVAIILPTSPGFVAAFFGVLCAGAVPVPLYPPVRLGRL